MFLAPAPLIDFAASDEGLSLGDVLLTWSYPAVGVWSQIVLTCVPDHCSSTPRVNKITTVSRGYQNLTPGQIYAFQAAIQSNGVETLQTIEYPLRKFTLL